MMNIIKRGASFYKQLPIEKKAMLWYTFCNICQKGVAFLTIPIITRLLSTEEYGIYSVFISWRDILIIFATLNLYCGVFTKLLVDHKDDQDKCTSCLQGLGCTVTLIFAAVYYTFSSFWNELLDMNIQTVTLLIVYYFFFPAFSLWSTKQRVNNRYIAMVVVTILVSVSVPVLSISLLLFTSYRDSALIFGNIAIYAVVGAIFFVINLSKGKQLYDRGYWSFSLKYNIPLIPHYLAMIILGQSDRLMIDYFCGESEAGIYSLAYQISMMMNILFNAVNSSFIPRSYILMRDKAMVALKKESLELVYIGLLMTFLATLMAPECVLFMGGVEYLEAIYVLPPICTGVFITFYYGFFSGVEFYFSKTKNVTFASALSSIINIILNWVLIPLCGYIAAGYTTLVSYLFLLMFHYISARGILKEHYNQVVFDNKSTFLVIMASLVSMAVSLTVYDNAVLRYSLIMCIVLTGCVWKKLFKK